MKEIKYKRKVYKSVEINSAPEEIRNELKYLSLSPNKCLENSYNIAKAISGAKLVEGWLVTEYADGSIECVGHVWNEINGVYFDQSFSLIKHDKEIKSSDYYFIDSYSFETTVIKEMRDLSRGLLHAVTAPLNKHIFFKTQAKDEEKKLRNHLIKIKKAENKKD